MDEDWVVKWAFMTRTERRAAFDAAEVPAHFIVFAALVGLEAMDDAVLQELGQMDAPARVLRCVAVAELAWNLKMVTRVAQQKDDLRARFLAQWRSLHDSEDRIQRRMTDAIRRL